MKPIVKVHNVAKRYRIGSAETASDLRETIYKAFRAPFRRYKKNLNGDGDAATTLWALKDISFEVQPGEIFGIIGRNGAGKSTLLKILSRVTQPTTGHIELFGRMGSLLEVGTGFHPELTGRENVFLNGAVLGMARAEIRRKFDEIIAFAEIERFLDTPVKHYSSGMYMRLAFAVAAFLEPEILVVDEVLAVGDVEFQQKCLGKMGDLRRHGRTVLIVSHNMASIVNLCQRALLLERGKIIADGVPADVIQKYLSQAKSVLGQIVWPDLETAPGNDDVRLRSVSILQEGIVGPTADVGISKEVLVEIVYENLKAGAPLYSGIWLKTGSGTFVLSSGNAPSMSLAVDPWYAQPHPRGTFRSVCRIPGNFLNEGSYSITAIVGKSPQNTQILEESIVSFQVHDTGEMRKEYLGSWAGPVVRPRLAWNTRHIES
ncbi:MAG: ABC transporter ATP-binding protein [Acidobacteria bacterium]|nr:MAG: ABC transporter ATP-binding protein [Acidobacteriota bacterium]